MLSSSVVVVVVVVVVDPQCRCAGNRRLFRSINYYLVYAIYAQVRTTVSHMGLEHAPREKKLPMVNFLIFMHKNVYRIRFQKIKIRPLKGFEKKAFFSLLLMRKRLSGGQKWFLEPYFPLIRGMFVFRSGLRFLFRALEVPELRVRKRPY